MGASTSMGWRRGWIYGMESTILNASIDHGHGFNLFIDFLGGVIVSTWRQQQFIPRQLCHVMKNLHLVLGRGGGGRCTTQHLSWRAGLDYNGEEVQWSIILREWCNTISYEMSSNWLGFTLWPRLIRWRTSNMDKKKTWLSTWQHFLLGGLMRRSSFLVSPSGKKLDLQKAPI